MKPVILGKKVGMTRVFDESGKQVPVTMIEAGPCVVTQIKTEEGKDGYNAVQIGFDEIKPRRSTFQVIGHDAKAGVAPQRFHREFRVEASELEGVELGSEVKVDLFEECPYVDVVGVSKGKGFQGTMKRHNFKGQLASHGVERKHRSPGSIASHSSNAGTGPKIKKGKKMAGHMGNERVTVRSLDVVGIDKENNLLLVKGPVPGHNGGMVMISQARRLFKKKVNIINAKAS